jgi:hypothetical protein
VSKGPPSNKRCDIVWPKLLNGLNGIEWRAAMIDQPRIGVAGVRVLPISNDAALGARGNSPVDGGTPNCFTTMLEGGLV